MSRKTEVQPRDRPWPKAPERPANASIILLHYTDFSDCGREYGFKVYPNKWETEGVKPPATWFWPFWGEVQDDGRISVGFHLNPKGWRGLGNPEDVQLLAFPVKRNSNILTGQTWICGLGDPEPFDPEKHVGKVVCQACACGCGAWEGWEWYFALPPSPKTWWASSGRLTLRIPPTPKLSLSHPMRRATFGRTQIRSSEWSV